MKDIIFYPVIMLLFVGIVLAAILFNRQEPIDVTQGFVVSGAALHSLTASPGTQIALLNDSGHSSAYITTTAHMAREIAPPSAGVFATITRPYLEYFAGKTVQVSVIARQGQTDPNEALDIGLFLYSKGRVDWTRYALSKNFEAITFESEIGALNPDHDIGYIGVWPDVKGLNRTVDIQSISIKVIEAEPGVN